MKKECGSCALLKGEPQKSTFTTVEPAKDSNYIEGIFMALRYLSLEAEGAGLIDLANTLGDAAQQYGHYIAQDANGYEGS
jgi:hypothetical protein